MGDEDKRTEPSLELPKLFGRKKTRPTASPEATAPDDDTQVIEPTEDTRVIEPVEAPVEASVEAPAETPAETPVEVRPERQTVPAMAEDDRPLFVDEAPARPAKQPKPPKAPKAAKAPAPAREPRPPAEDREPIVTGRVAAALTGLLVGAAMVAATAGSLKACEAVQGTASCGAAGFPILLAIVVAAVVIGSALLRAFRVPDAGSTSFLAVGSLAVIALLVFIDVLDRWWMIIVIPLVGVATYLLSHWVTTTFIDAPED